ncbi:MAG: hypothetical protein ACE5OR_08360 [bacterium]
MSIRWDYNAEKFYRMALYDRNEAYYVWNTKPSGTPEANLLKEYETVIWFIGASDPTITPEEEASLISYLDRNGSTWPTTARRRPRSLTRLEAFMYQVKGDHRRR